MQLQSDVTWAEHSLWHVYWGMLTWQLVLGIQLKLSAQALANTQLL